mgnify:FL=1
MILFLQTKIGLRMIKRFFYLLWLISGLLHVRIEGTADKVDKIKDEVIKEAKKYRPSSQAQEEEFNALLDHLKKARDIENVQRLKERLQNFFTYQNKKTNRH